MNLFVYGTLRHRALLDVVLGRTDVAATPARLPDHAVHWVDGQAFPILAPELGAAADGLLLLDLGAEELARLNYYESGFDYTLTLLAVDGASVEEAQVYVPSSDIWPVGAIWSLEEWAGQWGAMTVHAAREAMDGFGTWTAEELADRFRMIRTRAWARHRAEERGPASPNQPEVVTHHRPYTNFFAVQEFDLRIPRFDGSQSEVLNRAAFFVGEASVVLPYDPHLDAVLLIEQFRVPVFATGDPDPWMTELISGLIDPGETPQEAAHREAMEEARLTLGRLELVGAAYSGPGASTEFVHMFVGLTDLSATNGSGGLASEGEDIRTSVVPYDTLMQDIDAGHHRNMPLLTAAFWLARHRARLRENA